MAICLRQRVGGQQRQHQRAAVAIKTEHSAQCESSSITSFKWRSRTGCGIPQTQAAWPDVLAPEDRPSQDLDLVAIAVAVLGHRAFWGQYQRRHVGHLLKGAASDA